MKGRNKKERSEHFTQMYRNMMETLAWRSLSTTAQAIYPWLKLEWRGKEHNNNGRLCISYRTLCEKSGIGSKTTVTKAFAELQAKGFVIVTSLAHLGSEGTGRGHLFELTEQPPQGERIVAKRLFERWTPGNDFPVQAANVNNPQGRNHHRNWDTPSQKLGHSQQ
jgi:Helix-turn-helix domain